MSLNSLKIATDGYLKRATKAALIIAVAGYLNFSSTSPTPSPTPIKIKRGGGIGGGTHKYKQEQVDRLRDDEEILSIIKVFLTWQE